MKQLIVIVLLLLSTSAWAEWTRVGGNDTFVVYADVFTIRKASNTVTMWTLYDYKTTQTLSTVRAYLSAKTQSEYDCDGERMRMLYASLHSGKMGYGELVYAQADPKSWEPAAPGSIGAVLWRIACTEWTRVGNDHADTMGIYADIAAIRKAGNMVKMWDLLDFKTAQRSLTGRAYLSGKAQKEYDCDGERERMLYLSLHSENMGGGDIVDSIVADPGKWTPVDPGSIGERLLKIACKR